MGNPGTGARVFDRSLKTALLLADLADEVGEDVICERYSFAPANVYGMVESVACLSTRPGTLRGSSPRTWPAHRGGSSGQSTASEELLPLIRNRGIAGSGPRAQQQNHGSVDALRACGAREGGQDPRPGIAPGSSTARRAREEVGDIGEEQSTLSPVRMS
jgi:helicase